MRGVRKPIELCENFTVTLLQFFTRCVYWLVRWLDVGHPQEFLSLSFPFPLAACHVPVAA